MNKDCVIIGGGVAGLCAAIRLTELGVRPLVVESGNYPSHKVCGEFFSPESLTLLEKWNIHPIAVKQAQFYAGSKSLDFTFPVPAGGLSHIEFDPLLVQRAREGGAEILTGTKVVQLRSGSPYHEIELSTGEVIQSPDLIVATGRIPQFHSTPVMRYMGIKAHFEGLFPENTLSMFFFDGAYVGMSPVENG